MDAERGGGGGEATRFSSASLSQPSNNNPNQNPNSYINSSTTTATPMFGGLGVGVGIGSNPSSISSSSSAAGGPGQGGQIMMQGYRQHFNNGGGGSSGSGMVSPSSISFNTVLDNNSGEQVKRRRGRPRRYTLDNGSGGGSGGGGGDHNHHQNNNSNANNHVGLGLNPVSSASPPPSAYSNNTPSSSDPAVKRNRGRPLGTGKKQQQQLDSLGSSGGAFTPHVIAVKAGEDVASKIMAFLQQGPHAICILSANGAVSNATLRHLSTFGGTVTYEGRFEIISLSGSFLLTDNGVTRSRTGGMSVALAGSDGRVLGGGVAGMLMAATPVQVVVVKFIVEEKPKAEPLQREPASALPGRMMGFGTSVATASSPSQGVSSDSSDEEEEEELEDSIPLNQVPSAFNGPNQSMQNMSGYPSINWGPSHLSYPSRHDPKMNNLHN